MKRIYNEIDSCSTAEEAKEKSQQWSLHPIYISALPNDYLFVTYKTYMHDIMHLFSSCV